MQHGLIYFFYPILLVAVAIEIYFSSNSRHRNYHWQESIASLWIFLIHHLTQILFRFVPTGILFFAWQHRLLTVSFDRWWSIPLLFISLEFCYYWYHRAAHQVRWLWATHAVHHSIQYFNLSAAYRLGWTGWLSGNILFFMPLSWLGFHPMAVGIGLSLNLLYQFWIHTELIPKLGVFELVFNTPSHHRVHHASNSEYIDRNYGGVLIIFDRLFGTFVAEKSDLPIIYGLTHSLAAHNPVKIALYEWYRILKDIVVAKTWRERLRAILGAPV
ncbi:sterol desaturase family protein [Chamaesiphon minutus]|uniref:Sterol desaturase n=1 Tax=Chamaesiphon minutus (strain ATCC 27169 / PCC 6605) TaxID=1173020 RepID=K9UI90_CHAP6|nr:sterol desaturase family protein [Chamaesiphon minutus]AFY94176.1 sterol desaturase [Chamaesiphon minutus PCC 6605]